MYGKAYECRTGCGQFKRVQRSRMPARACPKEVTSGSQCCVAPLPKDMPLAAGRALPWLPEVTLMVRSFTGQNTNPNHASLSALDIAAAAVFHVLILAIVLAFGLWHRQTQEIHFKSVKVHLISAHQLERLQHRVHPKTKHHKPKIKPKPVVKPKPKPVLKLKPKPVLKHKAKLKPKAEDNFDPFKPMESTTDVESAPVISPKAAQVFQGQLSKQEINRYIALIQAAVQSHWKVPNIGKDVKDPLVEMVLNPGGSVREVRILESSGNTALDASLVRAIEAASPFQVPREQFELFRNNKIRFHPLR